MKYNEPVAKNLFFTYKDSWNMYCIFHIVTLLPGDVEVTVVWFAHCNPLPGDTPPIEADEKFSANHE